MPKNNGKTEKDKSREQEVPKDKEDNTKSPSPTVHLAVTTAMTSSAEGSGKDRYPFHVDSKTPLKGVEPKPKDPTVRLASTGSMTTGGESGREKRYPFSQDAPPQVRLAHVPGAQGDNVLLGRNGVERMSDTSLPALLVSYYYLEKFIEHQHRYFYRDWVMDSGAFSAFSSGVTINLQEYIKCCKRLMQTDPTLVEIFALDVIGDWKGTKKNTEEMWRQGVPAIPCFHYGEPWDVLKGYCKDYPKVALGGCVGKRDKLKFVGQCFARCWPHKFHGFGFGDEAAILGFPFQSTDATNWELTPCLTGDSLVSTSEGLIPISELVDKDNFTVNTYTQVQVPGCRAIHSGKKSVLDITLNTGQVLRCTWNHKILTDDGWVMAKDLDIGSKIRMIDKQVKTPVIQESLLDEMLGWTVGDGSYLKTWRKDQTHPHGFACILFALGADRDDEAMEKLMPVWDDFVEKSYAIHVQHGVARKSCENGDVLIKFHDLGFKFSTARNKEIPKYLFTAESHKQLAFLRGLFSADGSVKRTANGIYDTILLASNSPTLLRQVQIILLEYGIQSRISWSIPWGKNEKGQLTIAGVFAHRYMEIIGFNLSRKTDKFGFKTEKFHKLNVKTTYNAGMGKWKRNPPKYAIVKSIDDDGEVHDVYDIVMPHTHHFVANGLVVHNCGFGRWRAFGGAKISVRGSSQNLRCEVLYYLDLEEKARKKWKKEMELLEEKFPIPRLYQGPSIMQEEDNTLDKKDEKTSDPSVKLAVSDGKARGGKLVVRKVLEDIGSNSPNLNPTVRLAESGMGSYDSERQKGKLRALQPEKE